MTNGPAAVGRKEKKERWNDIRNKLIQTKALKAVTRARMRVFSSNDILYIALCAIQCRTGHVETQ